MEKDLEEIKKKIDNEGNLSSEELTNFLSKNILSNRIEEYIGDYPTFIEPVVLGKNVIIGDDVLLGPNVYIGDNCEIGDYDEISNSIIFNNVKLGEIFKLDHCVVVENSKLTFKGLDLTHCLLNGEAETKNNLDKRKFK